MYCWLKLKLTMTLRVALICCIFLSILTFAYSCIARSMPVGSMTKVHAILRDHGGADILNEPSTRSALDWSILGLKTTWTPTITLCAIQTFSLIAVTAKLWPRLR